jgi:hypothetical protein
MEGEERDVILSTKRGNNVSIDAIPYTVAEA